MVKRPVGVFLFPIFLILTLIPTLCGSARAGASSTFSAVEAAKGVLRIKTYDWKGTLLREGMGYFSDRDGTITTVVPVIEGGYFVEAISPDGTEYIVEKINPLSEVSGLVFTHLEEKPLDFIYVEKVAPLPVQGDEIWIPGVDGVGTRILKRTSLLEARSVPGYSRYLYVKTSLPLGDAGSPVINEKGEVAGMVLLPGDGPDNTGIIVSTGMIRSSYGVSGEVVSLLTWTDGLTKSWYEQEAGLYLKGIASYHLGNYQNAVDCFVKIMDGNDRSFRKTRLVLGDCYREMGDPLRAIDAYEKALKHVKKLSDPHLNLTRLYLKLNKVTDARRILEKAPQHNKENSFSVIMSAWLLDATGNRNEALEAAKNVAEMDPKYAWAHGTVGEILNKQGRFEEAFLALEQSVLLKPYRNEFTGEFCYAALRSGRHLQATKICSEAARSGLEKAQSLMHLGDAFAAENMQEKALESYRLSIKEDPGNVGAWCRRGDLLASAGHHQEAVSVFLDALEKFPDSAWLRFKLGKVCGNMGDQAASARQVRILEGSNQALARQLSLTLMTGSTVPRP